MTSEEMDREFERAMELYKRLEQSQVEANQDHARWHVNFQRSLDALVAQQAKASAEMAELRDWGKELAKSQVRMQNSVADLKEQLAESHKQLAESHRQLSESNRQMIESQKKADERFSAFLAALEQRFGKNGQF